jgi:hypothetical protein
MCNLYSITTNQAAIIALFRVINRYVGNLPGTKILFREIFPPRGPAGNGIGKGGRRLSFQVLDRPTRGRF